MLLFKKLLFFETSEMHSTAIEICRKLQNAGFKAFFAGGAVRDKILGVESDDIDIATDARPEDIERIFARSFSIGRHFGVIVIQEDGHLFEIATFRSDSPFSDGRRPKEVFFADERTDAFRRDFTINALFFDPISEEIFDFVGGQQDIKEKILRFVGDPKKRIEEDCLRMLRAIRFKNRFGLSFAPETAEAILAKREAVRKISPQRVREELSKMLLHSERASSFRDLFDFGILEILLPEVAHLAKIPDAFEKKTVFEHTLRALSFLRNPNPELAWAILLHDTGKAETRIQKADRWHFPDHESVSEKRGREICRRLFFSRFSTEKIAWLVKNHIRFYSILKMTTAHRMHFFDEVFFEDLIALARADSLGSDGNDTPITEIERNFHEAHEQRLLPQFHPDLLSGAEILEITKLPPSPRIGKLKSELRHLQMDGKITDKESAIQWLLKKEQV